MEGWVGGVLRVGMLHMGSGLRGVGWWEAVGGGGLEWIWAGFSLLVLLYRFRVAFNGLFLLFLFSLSWAVCHTIRLTC